VEVVKSSGGSILEAIISLHLLVHFGMNLKICLVCDTFAYGIGMVASYQMPNGYGKPIGFASRTLTNAEKTVLPVGRALACVHGE